MSTKNEDTGFINQPAETRVGLSVGNTNTALPYQSQNFGLEAGLKSGAGRTYIDVELSANLGATQLNSDIIPNDKNYFTKGVDLSGEVGYAPAKNISFFGGAEFGICNFGSNDTRRTAFVNTAMESSIFGGVGFTTNSRGTEAQFSVGGTAYKGFGIEPQTGTFGYAKTEVKQTVFKDRYGSNIAIKASAETPLNTFKPSYNIGAVLTF